MLLSEKIDEIIERNIKISDELYAVNNGVIIEFSDKNVDNIQLMNMFISIIPALIKMGLDIEEDIPLRQIKNMEKALETKDFMMLADTLRYEVNDTLSIVKELVVEGVIKNEELL